jgi:hypothetical protein
VEWHYVLSGKSLQQGELSLNLKWQKSLLGLGNNGKKLFLNGSHEEAK